MAKTIYDVADATVNALVTSVIKQYHSDLHDAGLTVNTLLATKTDKEGASVPAIVIRGNPESAKIRKTTPQERTRGREDIDLTIDATDWNKMDELTRKALVSHQLSHYKLVPAEEDDGSEKASTTAWKTDDNGRPALKFVPHDIEYGGHSAVATIFGVKSQEVIKATKIVVEFGDKILPDGTTATKKV